MTAVGITWGFAVVGYLGIPLTMVTISGLPILIGLGVDFAIQLHSRYEEEAAQADGDPLARTVRRLGPALGVAMVAAVVGFLALRLSSVPMIRDFGVLLAVGAAMAFLAVWTVTPVALVWRDRRDRRRPRRRRASKRRGIERAVQGMAGAFGGHPAALASVAVLLIGGGVWAQQRTPVESDPERFVPQDSSVLRDLHHLRDVAGTSADMGLFIEADDVTRADVLAWMADFEARALEDHPGQLLRSASIASITASVSGATPTPGDTAAVLAVTPPALERMFVSKDRTEAQILFSVGHLSLDDQERLLDELRHGLDPPAGVRVTPSGLAVIGIATVNALESNQTSMAWAAAGAVLAWLLLAFRSLRRAGLVLVPVLTAVGASALLVELLGLQVSALGALSSPLVVAICTEFSVLIVERYLEERRGGPVSRRRGRDRVIAHRPSVRRLRPDRGRRVRGPRRVGIPAPDELRDHRGGEHRREPRRLPGAASAAAHLGRAARSCERRWRGSAAAGRDPIDRAVATGQCDRRRLGGVEELTVDGMRPPFACRGWRTEARIPQDPVVARDFRPRCEATARAHLCVRRWSPSGWCCSSSPCHGWSGGSALAASCSAISGEPVTGAGIDAPPLGVDRLARRSEAPGALAVGLAGDLDPQVGVESGSPVSRVGRQPETAIGRVAPVLRIGVGGRPPRSLPVAAGVDHVVGGRLDVAQHVCRSGG